MPEKISPSSALPVRAARREQRIHDRVRQALMPKIAVSRPVRHGAGEMFDLVADVERYPEVVPLCEKLVLRSRSREAGKDVLVADMSVGYKSFRETFTTRVTVDRA